MVGLESMVTYPLCVGIGSKGYFKDLVPQTKEGNTEKSTR